MVVVDSVCKVFQNKSKKTQALRDVSFKCDKGQIFGLLGPNGAGKTTLLRILATIMRPTSGNVRINGYHSISQALEIKRMIGYLSCETGIYDRFTPREILGFFAKINGINKESISKSVDHILYEMEMSEYADTKVDRFSTGMKQKVSIARSLIHDPPVIVFDEPTNGLDVVAGRIIKNMLKKLKDDGKCVILSTHLMNDVDELCDRIGFIYKGRIVMCENKQDLKSRFKTNSLEEIFFKVVEVANEN